MLKKFMFSAIALCVAYSAQAQVVTARLDPAFVSVAPAATGWRFNSNISVWGTSAEGKNTHDGGSETGEVKAGLPARGPDDHSSLPYASAAYRGQAFAAEISTFTKNGANYDVEMDLNSGSVFDTYGFYYERKTQTLKLAYVFGEALSVGLGYTRENKRVLVDFLGSTVSQQSLNDQDDAKSSLTASFRFADIFYLGAGVEAVQETGTYEKAHTLYGTDKGDLADNSWNNTLLGVALMSGDPENFQFRMEYSQITSPESVAEGDSPNQKNTHRATAQSFTSVEARFGGFLLGYHHTVENQDEADGYESETINTMVGLGWVPLQGLMVSVYAWDNEFTSTYSGIGEIATKPKGYTLHVGYNF